MRETVLTPVSVKIFWISSLKQTFKWLSFDVVEPLTITFVKLPYLGFGNVSSDY